MQSTLSAYFTQAGASNWATQAPLVVPPLLHLLPPPGEPFSIPRLNKETTAQGTSECAFASSAFALSCCVGGCARLESHSPFRWGGPRPICWPMPNGSWGLGFMALVWRAESELVLRRRRKRKRKKRRRNNNIMQRVFGKRPKGWLRCGERILKESALTKYSRYLDF